MDARSRTHTHTIDLQDRAAGDALGGEEVGGAVVHGPMVVGESVGV